MVSFVRDLMTRNNSLFRYSGNGIKEVETGVRTDIFEFLKEPLSSGWGNFIIDNGMINIVVNPSQTTIRLPPGTSIIILVEYQPQMEMLESKWYTASVKSFLNYYT